MLFGSLPKAVQENVQHKLDEVSQWWSDLFLNDGVIHCKLATLIHMCMFFPLKHVRRMLGEGECETCELEKGAKDVLFFSHI